MLRTLMNKKYGTERFQYFQYEGRNLEAKFLQKMNYISKSLLFIDYLYTLNGYMKIIYNLVLGKES